MGEHKIQLVDPNVPDALDFLKGIGVFNEQQPLRLHLGCGTRRFNGYVNIDYPPDYHTVQAEIAADVFADITKLRFDNESVDEIRLHHVFEHFSRAVALGLLASWWSWLKVDGLLRIEVPDFERTAWAVLSPLSTRKARFVGLRHIFGSQEAQWAVHMEGWSIKEMHDVLNRFGYKVEKTKRNTWRGTYNIEVLARKRSVQLSGSDFLHTARDWLVQYTVDESPSELHMLDVWMEQYQSQIRNSIKTV